MHCLRWTTPSTKYMHGLACATEWHRCHFHACSSRLVDLPAERVPYIHRPASCPQLVHAIPDTHKRAPHTLVQPAASPLLAHAPAAYEAFATAAADGSVRLWDVRTMAGTQCLTGHANGQGRVGAAFSPCLRFLAVGGEDGAGMMYDLRMGRALARLRAGASSSSSASDSCAAVAVAFNPQRPQLSLGCMDGSVHFFETG
jgi:hypothetical protein